MYPKYGYLACVICVLCGLVSSDGTTTLSLSTANIFYDVVDPKCVDFFSNKFVHVYPPFEQYVDVNLVPFGKAELIDGKLTCPTYGDVECYASRVHACALKFLQKTADKIKFVVCTMDFLNVTDPKNVNQTTYPTEKCISLVNVHSELNVTSMSACVSSNQSTVLLEKYSNDTKLLGTVDDWPVITLNSEPYNAQTSQNLVANFTGALCKKFENDASLSGVHIPVCKSNSSSSTTPKPHTTTTSPNKAAAINSITYWPIVIATTFTMLFGVKLGY